MKRSKTFEDYQNLLRRLAWSFHYTTGLEWDDLYSEACLGYVKAMSKFDVARSAPTTWIYCAVKNHLIGYAAKQKPLPPISFRTIFNLTPEDIVAFRQAIFPRLNRPWKGSDYARDIRTVINLVFSSPAEYLAESGRGLVGRRLKQMGWSKERIHRTLQGVQSVL